MGTKTKHTVVEVHDLSVGYRSKKNTHVISEGLNFSLKKGTLISLVGANGIGKSTLLRTLSAMQESLNGSITINKKDIGKMHPQELATQLSVVLTEAPASKTLSVVEFIALGRQPHTNWYGKLSVKDKEKISWAMEHTDTSNLQHQPCHELSDGQLQRVAIARALAQDTPVIILDEPTTHLDVYHRAYVLQLLKKLSNEMGKTVLFSTHEIDLAIQLSDEMMVFTSEKLAHGSPAELVNQGIFGKLFPQDIIHFDKETGRFTIS